MYKLTCCLAVAVTGLGGKAVAAVINVPGQFPTIQADINAAVKGDEIVVAPGVYQETVLIPLALVITVRGPPADHRASAARRVAQWRNMRVGAKRSTILGDQHAPD